MKRDSLVERMTKMREAKKKKQKKSKSFGRQSKFQTSRTKRKQPDSEAEHIEPVDSQRRAKKQKTSQYS